jgi:CubicO group peptidase (beta-lactamase class C family)
MVLETRSTVDLSSVSALMQRFVDAGEVDGAAIAVARGDVIVGETYVGNASADHQAGPETLWPLASISKVYTAATVVALVERGELTLSTPVRSVLPRFDGDSREKVTLRHLLTHTSGLIYESPDMEAALLRHASLDEIVDEAYTFPLEFAPGSHFGYSDYGIALAARVASVATHTSFPALVRELVLEPADLHDTFLPPSPDAYPRLARVVGCLADGTDAAQYNSPYGRSLAHPAFGVVATARDLLRFALLFAPGSKHRIHSEATASAMTRDQTGGEARGSLIDTGPNANQPWGLGIALPGPTELLGFGDLSSPDSFGHPGASGCTFLVDPTLSVSLAYCSNRHLRTGLERFSYRLDAVVNHSLAALTTRIGEEARR